MNERRTRVLWPKNVEWPAGGADIVKARVTEVSADGVGGQVTIDVAPPRPRRGREGSAVAPAPQPLSFPNPCCNREEREEGLFRAGMRAINLVYAHAKVTVFLLTDSAIDLTSGEPIAGRPRDYFGSGWTVFEMTISRLFKDMRELRGLGMWPGVVQVGAVSRDKWRPHEPPQSPAVFASRVEGTHRNANMQLDEPLHFTNGEVDGPMVVDKYEATLRLALGDKTEFQFSNAHWDDADMVSFAPTLALCPKLKYLNVSRNKLGDAGLAALAAALEQGYIPDLKSLWLGGNTFGKDGLHALVVAIGKGGPDGHASSPRTSSTDKDGHAGPGGRPLKRRISFWQRTSSAREIFSLRRPRTKKFALEELNQRVRAETGLARLDPRPLSRDDARMPSHRPPRARPHTPVPRRACVPQADSTGSGWLKRLEHLDFEGCTFTDGAAAAPTSAAGLPLYESSKAVSTGPIHPLVEFIGLLPSGALPSLKTLNLRACFDALDDAPIIEQLVRALGNARRGHILQVGTRRRERTTRERTCACACAPSHACTCVRACACAGGGGPGGQGERRVLLAARAVRHARPRSAADGHRAARRPADGQRGCRARDAHHEGQPACPRNRARLPAGREPRAQPRRRPAALGPARGQGGRRRLDRQGQLEQRDACRVNLPE